MNYTNVKDLNDRLSNFRPEQIVAFFLELAERPIVTTNFRPYEAAILNLVANVRPTIKIIWCDTGYNTPDTYKHAIELIDRLNLNVKVYTPLQTAGYRDAALGIPDVNDPLHRDFTEQVKLEPFNRAINEHQPDVWFTNLRKGQTQFRDNLDIVSMGANGILKVSPFYYWSDLDLDGYLEQYSLPNEFNYFDPTKQLENRECGLHQ